MSIETKSMHITPVGGNVFADLGFEPEEAAALKAESQRIISEKLVIKDSLMTDLAGWIEAKRRSSSRLKLRKSSADTSTCFRRNQQQEAIKISIDALVGALARTGKHVQLSVH
jgi:predicted XRE-type DNA-binding protein